MPYVFQDKFIPNNPSIPNRDFNENIYPELISDQKGVKLYFGQDHQFLRPKGVIGFKILLPKDKMSNKYLPLSIKPFILMIF